MHTGCISLLQQISQGFGKEIRTECLQHVSLSVVQVGEEIALDLIAFAEWPVAQRRLSDVESSGDGDELYDDEDFSSGSGSGFPDMDVRPSAASVAFTTKEPLPLSTTQATGPAPSAPPAAEPSRPPAPELERESGLGQDVDTDSKPEMENEKKWEIEEEDRDQESVTEIRLDQERPKATVAPRLTDVPEVFVDSTTTLGETTVAPSDLEEEDDLYITTETMMFEPSTPETTTDDITTIEVMPTTVSSTTVKSTRARPAPTTPSPAPVRPRQPQTTPSPAPVRPRQPQTTPSRAAPTESSTRSLMSSSTQTQTTDETVNNEVAGPGPSGDFEIRETEAGQGNELGRGRGAGEPDLSGNTVDAAGSSAAQLPQKNILERKEVLIAVIVGGVVGALFAAFLVMLLVYRMKKKDEGSYTLEEPKQATVTYQKPDKQEEFYA
ncbi:syndecan-3 [Rhinichthys klamathensis goyatoka]|uniref:syndecan-3 n=1 Tax=Rhinichthys klamathensis goyatoka TaxID=3034132 RepID=UPI0024B53F0A|nr:syndecan-3 [Rhinichthys klamathensis goyatoka]